MATNSAPGGDPVVDLAALRGGLVVSCQAEEGDPLHGPVFMAAFARAAEQAGAVGIRANGPEDIAAVRAACKLPLIGLYKLRRPGQDVYITPGVEEVRAVIAAGADIVAMDGTARPRPDGSRLAALFQLAHGLGVRALADVSTLEEGLAAEAAGADLLSTTLSGYTPYSPPGPEPDLDLVAALARHAHVPVLAEGRITRPEQARQALDAGAWAVVVGGAITRTGWIARQFVLALKEGELH